MTLSEFILTFLLMLVIGPVFIIGWYAITRGRTEYYPDSTPYQTGKIFKAWHFFWTKKNGHVPFVFTKNELAAKFLLLKEKGLAPGLTLSDSYIFHSGEEVFRSNVFLIEKVTGCKVQVFPTYFRLWKEVPSYVFPEWVRDPVSECPTCMASVYGTLFYWTIIGLAKYSETVIADGVSFSENLSPFAWSSVPTLAAIMFWVVYCIGCAFVNTILSKKL